MFKRIMVGLDRTAVDINLIHYTSFICALYKPADIYFIHIEKDLEESTTALLGGGNVKKIHAIDELIKNELNQKVENYFKPNKNVQIHVEVHEGSLLREFLHWSKIKQVDLILMGNKHTQRGSGILPKQVARKADTNVLIIPEAACPEITKIAIPVDFSNHSIMGYKRSIEIANIIGGTSLTLLHAFWEPGWYYKMGYNYAQYRASVENKAKENIEAFFKKINAKNIELTSKIVLVPDNSGSAEQLLKEAERNGADFLVIGSRGKTSAATFLLGSTTEKLIEQNKNLPLMVEKEPGENITLLDVFLNRKR